MSEISNETVLYSQPIIVGRRLGSERKDGGGYLLVVNVSNRMIEVNFEIRDMNGDIISEGMENLDPGKIGSISALSAGMASRSRMYGKVWFLGSEAEIRSSFIMQTVEGPPGSETIAPVYNVRVR